MGGSERNIAVVLLMGPTASGKTDLAIELARALPLEIVSVDSALVYRGLDIGTGKPSPALLREIPHHLIDIRDPADSYSAGQFVADASSTIRDIHARGRVPLLVGGTMLYFRALTRGIAALPSADPAVRAELDARAAREGWPRLHEELKAIDPRAAARILPNDGQRIQRALEVFRVAGRPLSELQAATEPPAADFNFSALAWNIGERQELYRRIAARFRGMLEQGFLEEVRRLRSRGDLRRELPAIRAVGYRQLWRYLDGECGFEEAIDAAIVATRHLARRQLIWLRADPSVHWIEATAPNAAAQVRERVATLLRC